MAKHFSHPGSGTIHVPEDSFEANENEEEFERDIRKKIPSPTERATEHIKSLIQAHRAQTTEIPASSNLSATLYDRLTLTHATTLEFLHQFWSAFLSGDPNRAVELASLVESLSRALDRIDAVAAAAEKERADIVAHMERQSQEIRERTGKRTRVDYDAIGGGEKAVRELLGPVTRAVANATARYREALKQQMAEGEE